MSPEFAKAVDPFFIYVLDLLDRIGRNEEPDSSDEQVRIRGHLDRAEQRLGRREEWELTKYALVSWTDELLIDAPWEGRHWWVNNTLEFDIFKKNVRFEDFYIKAEEALGLTNKDALEVFYICVVLGFRGLYRDAAAPEIAQKIGIPSDLEATARRMATAIKLGQGVPPIREAPDEGRGAPPLDGKFRLLRTLVGFVGLLVAIVLIWVWVR